MAHDVVSVSLKKNIQSFRVIKYSAQIGHSLTIRLLLGALLDFPLIGLIIYVAMERLGFLISDLIFTQRILLGDDRFKMGTLGVFFKILSDVLLGATLMSLSHSTALSITFLMISSFGMGVGHALCSNYFDQYYKETIMGYLKNLVGKSKITHRALKPLSFSTLFLIFNICIIGSVFCLAYFLYFYYYPSLLLLFPIVLNLILLLKVKLDFKKFQNVKPLSAISLPPIGAYFTIHTLHLTLVNAVSMACLLPSCYFMVVSLFHDPAMNSQYNGWAVFILFTLGYEYLGSWGAQALASLPLKNIKLAMGTTALLLLLTTLFFTRVNILDFDILPASGSYWLFVAFPLIMSSGLKFIGTLSMGEILESSKKPHPQVVSYINLPGHLVILAYCFYLVFVKKSFPSPTQAFDSSLNLTIALAVLIGLFIFLKKQPAPKGLDNSNH